MRGVSVPSGPPPDARERLVPRERGAPRRSGILRDRPRGMLLLAFLVLLVSLIGISQPKQIGDGGEYMVQALRMSRLEPPALSRAEAERLQPEMERIGHGYQNDIPGVLHEPWKGDDGRYDMSHFWLYPTLAVPGIWATGLLGVNAHHAFTLVNLVLFLLAFGLASRRIGPAATVFLFGSPAIWWIDKGHTEIFTFSLFAVALLLLEERPWWSFVAFGALAAQNPAFVPALPFAAGAVAYFSREALRDRRLWIGAGVGALLVLLHPVYYLVRLGAPYPQSSWGAEPHLPSPAEVGAALWDANIGLFTNFPLLLPLLALGAILLFRRSKPALTPALLVGVGTAAVVLVVVAQTVNHNHGATRSMSRYGIWILPFALPLADAAAKELRGWGRYALAALVAGSVAVSIWTYHPAAPERYVTPTPLARYLWSNHPGIENPLAEVFFERVKGVEVWDPRPAMFSDCSKVLTVGGRWPQRCPEPDRPLPEPCTEHRALCYANRSDGSYEFTRAPGPSKRSPPE